MGHVARMKEIRSAYILAGKWQGKSELRCEYNIKIYF
jgi:hypothetical protein